jgi:radical SAM superfamily enzyme YgiQ (UPF0313 family)
MDFGSTFEIFAFSGESLNCYGLEIVKNVLQSKGCTIIPSVNYASSYPVLVSLYWPEQLLDFIKWRYSSLMKNKRVIVGGNYPTTSPQAVKPFCDAIYLGDGELWDGKSDQFIVSGTEPKKRAIAKHISPYLYEDLQQSRRTFVEISRGCKNKCMFCQYGWLKPYRECDYEDIIQNINRAKTKSIRIFAADRFQHSCYLKIRHSLDKAGKADTGSDVSIRFLLKHPDFLQFTNKVRIGIEGLSFRLRRMVGKPYTNDDIVRFCQLVADAGIKSLDWYMIYGLPTETDDDVDEFRNLILSLNVAMPIGYTIAIHWNAFTPSAQTPFQWEAPASGPFAKLTELLTKDHSNDKIKIYHKPKFTSEATLLKRMLCIRATDGTAKLAFNVAKNHKLLLNREFILSEYKKQVGLDLMEKWPAEVPLPWDRYCIYDKNTMLKARNKRINQALGTVIDQPS